MGEADTQVDSRTEPGDTGYLDGQVEDRAQHGAPRQAVDAQPTGQDQCPKDQPKVVHGRRHRRRGEAPMGVQRAGGEAAEGEKQRGYYEDARQPPG